jgi:hypothetical protein
MSRPLWSIELTIRLVNGQSGVINLAADTLTTKRDIESVMQKALRMVDTLGQQEMDIPQHQRPNLRAVHE